MIDNTPYGFIPDSKIEGDYITVLMDIMPPDEDRPKHSYDDFPSQKKGSETFWHNRGELHRSGDKPAYVRNESSGHHTLYERKWFKHNKEHRENDLPSNIILQTNVNPDDGSVKETTMYRYQVNGITHRDGDKPALIEIIKIYDSNEGKIIFLSYEEYFLKDGKAHRDGDKPAVRSLILTKKDNKRIVLVNDKEFYQNGEIHRDGDKPAVTKIHKYNNGNFKSSEIVYGLKGYLHRNNNKPAILKKFCSLYGDLVHLEEGFYINGSLHRDGDKPAAWKETPKKKLTVYSKHGEFDSSSHPAVFFHQLSSDEGESKINKFYYRFYSDGLEKSHDEEITNFLFNELKKFDPSLVNQTLNNCPVNQLESIIFSLTGIEYTQNIDDVKVSNEITNTRDGKYF